MATQEKLDETVNRLREIALDLNGPEVLGPCTEGRKCLEQTIRIGRSVRPLGYGELNPRKMCRACEIFWLVDLAKVRLEAFARLVAQTSPPPAVVRSEVG